MIFYIKTSLKFFNQEAIYGSLLCFLVRRVEVASRVRIRSIESIVVNALLMILDFEIIIPPV